jgi:hypothetical protein
VLLLDWLPLWGKLLSLHSEEVALVVSEGSSSYSKAGSDGNMEVGFKGAKGLNVDLS